MSVSDIVSMPAASRQTAARAAEPASEGVSRRSRRTRRELVEAARALLEEQGVTALTVKAVTERADVGHGTFYHHFPSAEAVLAAAIEESMRDLSVELERGFADADDKVWVFVASMSGTFRMLAAHPALAWMVERPQVLAAALREACGPFARRDLAAMVAAGDVDAGVLGQATRYWEWLMIGALVDVASRPSEVARAERSLLELVLRTVGIAPARIESVVGRLPGAPAARRPKAGVTTSPKRRREASA